MPVLEGESDELLPGNPTLTSLGIDVDHLLEQVASKKEHLQEDDDVPEDDIVGVSNMDKAWTRKVEDKRSVVSDLNVWRTKLVANPPAKAKPL
ncbi:hypothetical protein PsorP6_001457 [Peronosclerospora sorghi]|uniref:Uncharacterized protein n=1 Tax=Peronosclerospora sorghi TaxID=230839 RepID=A0ACC0WTC6_9STRA|nr:hypothetical protein PsorP6_001457 [Peronosclerospora sorghi]